jgi:16S rRNA (cytosine1402-N4)-methyltransferase
MNGIHTPVMLRECVEALAPRKDGIYLDCTAGLGGHTEAILEYRCKAICLDRDADALEQCKTRLARFGNRVTFIHGNYSDLDRHLDDAGEGKADGILIDCGVSSMQLDTADRGFSYRRAAPLDMRMDRTQGLTAAAVVNEWEYTRLRRILYDYGEERYAPQIARGITASRPISTTCELAEIISESMPARGRREAQHPARRTFQAIRIAVNSELESLEEALPKAMERLKPGGRAAVISFHSLEDRIVKRIFSQAAKGCDCPPAFPACVCGKMPYVKTIGRYKPDADETEANPRSASAVLRVIEKL